MVFKKRAFLKLTPIFFWLILISQSVLFLLPKTASADLWDTQEGLKTDIGSAFRSTSGTPSDIRVVVARIISVFLGLLGIIFLALILLAGYKWMMAQGDESKITEAKEQLRTSVIGLAIILAAWGITMFVMNSILKATDPNMVFPL
jgi:uncharacterized BrkB/YihY/UPF0761 family membrane protein